MKVMQILPRMNIGGVERGVLDLARYLKGRGIENIVVSGGGRLVEELNKVGVKHYKLPVYKKSPVSLFLISRLRKIIEKEKVDIVHARSRVPAWISFFATRGTNTCFITTAHGVYRSRRLSKIMGWGKFVICPSKLVARHMRENFATPTEKIITINRWVDLLKFKFTDYEAREESNIIVSMGRISPSKGYEHLIRAFRRVIRSNPYLILKIVGSVDQSKMNYFNYLKTLVSRFSLNYNIQFVGFRKDVENVLKGARILVVPSVIEESFGRVIVEAFACGVPVVASNIGALPEIIEDGRDGILVAPGDSEAISKAILDLLSNLQLAKDLAINARRKAERLYSLPQCTSRIEEVYKKTMELKRIMVIKTSSLGDLILIIPSLKAIKMRFPKSNVVLLTLKRYVSLFYDCPYVDKVIGLDNDYKKIKNILKITRESRRYGFDYIIDLQNSRTSHLIAFLSFAQKSFGFSRKLGFLLNSRVKFPKCGLIDPLTSQERILKCLGVEFKEKRLIFWNRKPTDISVLGAEFKNLIGINVSASSKWESKNWPLAHIRKLIESIYSKLPGFRAVLIGDRQAREKAIIIENSFKLKPINLCGKTSLSDLAEVLGKLKVFITPDTATLHLAQSLGIKTIALFGPTDPIRHTVKDSNLHIIFKKLTCSFCYNPKCEKKECMLQISPSEVFSKLKELVSA